MSRHRNVRSMNYSDEYDGYDDVYGHSVEDDYTISPSDAAFMYDRNHQPQMSAFLAEEDDIAEEDESELDNKDQGTERRDSETYQRPQLSDIDEARLLSCIEEIRNVIGDTISEQALVDTILKHDFNLNKSLDAILSCAASSAQSEDSSSKRQQEKKDTGKDQGAKRSTPSGNVSSTQPDIEFGALNLSNIQADFKGTPSIKVVPSLTKSQHVTKGFNVTEPNDGLKPDSNCATPRSGSPSSGRVTPAVADEAKTPSRGRDKQVDIATQYAFERGECKDQLHMVVIGHVDAGKSTLMGHLLYSLGQVNKKTMHKYEQESKKIGKQSFVFAWILDETGEERSRGVTMDVGQCQFESPNKTVTLLDAPGHKDFIPNMITGATQADVAFLVVDATRGEFETGFESGGQTREHALLVRSLGVSQLGVAVNKMETVGWSRERFDEIVSKLGSFLKQAGFRERDVKFVPCSGLTGENLVDKPNEPLLQQWYDGPCLLKVIDDFVSPERPITKPFRLSINDIFKGVGSGFSVSGHVENGAVQVGDRILVQPLNEPAQIKALCIDEMPASTAYAGDQISVTLSGVDMAHVSVGNILSDLTQPMPVTTHFEARIVIFNINIPITKGCTVILHHQSLLEQAIITRLIAQLNKSSGEVIKRRPRCLTRNSTALVEVQTSRPICMELYRDVKELGRFMLRVGGVTVAAGLVTKIF